MLKAMAAKSEAKKQYQWSSKLATQLYTIENIFRNAITVTSS